MTFKVNRHKIAEEYNTTSNWLSNHFTTRYSHTEKFATIEEKMEDIKSRVGFDKISGIEKSAECGCGTCPSCVTASKELDSQDLHDIGILKTYIMDVVSDPIVPNTVSSVMSKCQENEKISKILNKVRNKPLLTDYVKDQFSKCKSENYLNDADASYEPRSSENNEVLEENEPAYVGYGSYE